jgi:hypothetical protein
MAGKKKASNTEYTSPGWRSFSIEFQGVTTLKVEYNDAYVDTLVDMIWDYAKYEMFTINSKRRHQIEREWKRELGSNALDANDLKEEKWWSPKSSFRQALPIYTQTMEDVSRLVEQGPDALVREAQRRLAGVRSFIEGILPLRLSVMLTQLAAEAIMSVAADPTPRSDVEEIEKLFLPYALALIGRSKAGGDNRSRYNWEDPENLMSFASKVEELSPLWKYIKRFYNTNCDDPGWASMLRESSKFKALAGQHGVVPDDLLRRITNQSLNKREREPLTLALEHARRLLGIPEYKSGTLRPYYESGKKLTDMKVIVSGSRPPTKKGRSVPLKSSAHKANSRLNE